MNSLTRLRFNMIDAVGIAVFTTNVHMGNVAYGFVSLFAFLLLSVALQQIANK